MADFYLFEDTANVLANNSEAQQIDTNYGDNKQTQRCTTLRFVNKLWNNLGMILLVTIHDNDPTALGGILKTSCNGSVIAIVAAKRNNHE